MVFWSVYGQGNHFFKAGGSDGALKAIVKTDPGFISVSFGWAC